MRYVLYLSVAMMAVSALPVSAQQRNPSHSCSEQSNRCIRATAGGGAYSRKAFDDQAAAQCKQKLAACLQTGKWRGRGGEVMTLTRQ